MSKKNLVAPEKTLTNRFCLTYQLAMILLGIFLCTELTAQVDLNAAEKAIRMRQYERAFSLYLQAANAGDAEAQYQLANLYLLGRGVGSNEGQGIRWLRKSVEQNHAAAQYNLGLKLLDSDADYAATLFGQAAEQGYTPAVVYLQRLGESPQFSQDIDTSLPLWFGAARNNRVDTLAGMSADINNIDQQDETGRTALFVATEANSVDSVKWLLSKKADPNHRDRFGLSPLFEAIEADQANVLQILLDNGGDRSQTLNNGDNLLHYAIRLKHEKLVVLLIKKGVPINQTNREGWTPLDLANYSDLKVSVKQLQERGAQHGEGWSNDRLNNNLDNSNNLIASQLTDSNSVDLAKIVVSGNIGLLNQLIQPQSPLLNEQLNDGSSLLSLAVKNGDDKMVAALLNRGANIDQALYGGKTAIHVAATTGNGKIVQLLLEAGANPLAKTDDELDAVDLSIQSSQNNTSIVLLDFLLSKNIKAPFGHYLLLATQFNLTDIATTIVPHSQGDSTDLLGRNALWFAASNSNAEIIPLLIKTGVSTITVDSHGKTPFYVAIDNDCRDCAELLLKGIDINQQTASGNTALLSSAAKGNKEMVSWLLTKGADPETRNAQGNTALISAVQANSIDVVKLLVDAGANVTRKNKLGFSAVDIAEQNNNEIYKLLKGKSVLGIF